jgi:ribosomal protein L11 methyltransferase
MITAPFTPTILAHLETDEATARAIADAVAELFDPEEVATAAFEIASLTAGMQGRSTAPAKASPVRAGREGAMGTLMPDETGPWRLELHFAEPPDEQAIRALVADIAGAEAATSLAFAEIAATDWVANALAGLKPVRAGRFVVHGAHDRAALRAGEIGVEIEAALAFGTGHHGTTRGCLEHFDAVLKRRRPRRIVDIGTGTAVLAIAAAKALHRDVLAGEIDVDSTRVAAENARLNRVAHSVRPVRAAGLRHARLRATRRYDLVFANILARPLRLIAPEAARATAAGGELILSGLLPGDLPGVLSAYRAQGFSLASKREIEGWLSLTLRRGGCAVRKRG